VASQHRSLLGGTAWVVRGVPDVVARDGGLLGLSGEASK
jgi:hypothetical protein